MFNLDRIFDRYSKSHERYRLAATLEGHSGPINSFAFNPSGTMLASGGDDEVVRIWDVASESGRTVQVLTDTGGRWGQVTCLKFITSENTPMGTEVLCFGTGRGQFVIYRRIRKADDFVEMSTRCLFSRGDSVESVAFDPHFQRIAISSHYGKVKVFRYQSASELVELWSHEFVDIIPRAVLFADKGNSVLVYALETGIVYYKDSETSNQMSEKQLRSPVGNVSACALSGNILIDNMSNGFDLYLPNRGAPSHTFKVENKKKFVKNGVFGEAGKVAICGSDHGVVYVFGLSKKDLLHVLRPRNGGKMIQTVEAITTYSHHIIASGASDGKYSICLWKKPTNRTTIRKERLEISELIKVSINFLLLILVAIWTSEMWLPPVRESYAIIVAHISNIFLTIARFRINFQI